MDKDTIQSIRYMLQTLSHEIRYDWKPTKKNELKATMLTLVGYFLTELDNQLTEDPTADKWHILDKAINSLSQEIAKE